MGVPAMTARVSATTQWGGGSEAYSGTDLAGFR
jgi:hypothetical protein